MTVLSVLDSAGRRRSPATMPGYHAGRPPRNKGMCYPADPPTVEEIVAVMRHAAANRHGWRPRAMIVMLWRAGLRVQEALALAEHDLDRRRGSVLVRSGKGGRRREVGMDEWGWEHLRPWLSARAGTRSSSRSRARSPTASPPGRRRRDARAPGRDDALVRRGQPRRHRLELHPEPAGLDRGENRGVEGVVGRMPSGAGQQDATRGKGHHEKRNCLLHLSSSLSRKQKSGRGRGGCSSTSQERAPGRSCATAKSPCGRSGTLRRPSTTDQPRSQPSGGRTPTPAESPAGFGLRQSRSALIPYKTV
jgi:Phage integrase family